MPTDPPNHIPTNRMTGHLLIQIINHVLIHSVTNSPAKSDSIFITLIVTAPIIQIISIAFGITHLFVELAPQIRKYRVYRSWAARIVTYTLQSFFAVLFYQVSGRFLLFRPSIYYLMNHKLTNYLGNERRTILLRRSHRIHSRSIQRRSRRRGQTATRSWRCRRRGSEGLEKRSERRALFFFSSLLPLFSGDT